MEVAKVMAGSGEIAALLLALALGACAEPDLSQPLTGIEIRQGLAGRMLVGTGPNGGFTLRLDGNGIAVRYGANAEFGHWQADEQRGLCLAWSDAPPSCAPVYQLNAAHYRVGALELGVLGARL